MKPLFVFYANCQADGIVHFLRQCSVFDDFDIVVWHNWQILMKEQDPVAMMSDVARADIFVYQPASELGGAPSTDQIVRSHLPRDCRRVSFPYLYNHGFFPWIRVGVNGVDGWIAGEELKQRIRDINRVTGSMLCIYMDYNAGNLRHDCARRFIECLSEQSRREATMDIKMTDWILANYRDQQLFITENHPTSAVFVELTRRVLEHLHVACSLSWKGLNDVGMNGEMPIHPDVVRELGLKFQPTDGAHQYFRQSLERMVSE